RYTRSLAHNFAPGLKKRRIAIPPDRRSGFSSILAIFRSPPGPPGHYLGRGFPAANPSREKPMPTTPLRSVLEAALSGACPGRWRRTEAELLAAFASARDEEAFAELVRRHGRLVWGTARRVAGASGAAEDVFQATFLLLARKATTVCWGPTVGPWLYQA